MAAFLLLLPTCVAALAQETSLEAMRAYAFPESMTAAQAAGRVAWSSNDQGIRNVWTARAPDYRPEQLTAYTKDDGQELSSLALSADGKTLVYVRGGEHSGNWDETKPINPLSSTQATKVEIWTVALPGGQPRLIGEGDFPVLSPDGQRLAFLREGSAWIASSDGKSPPRPAFDTRGNVHSLAWSPDGRRLAFVVDRGSHALIGMHGDGDTSIQWIAPSFDRDDSPRWSPDGKQLLFVRMDGESGLPKPRLERHPTPWSIWVADTTRVTVTVRWRSGKTLRDSYPWGTPPEWADAGRIIFQSYQDGWMHLYSLPAQGDSPLLLTPGAFQVEHARLSPDLRSVVYSANAGTEAGDDERRHLFRVPVDAPTPKTLTAGTGLEWNPTPTSDGRLLFLSATAQRPPVPAMLDPRGQPILLSETPTYPSHALVVPKPVQFKAADGMTVRAQLFEPTGGHGPRPAVVYVHGGPMRQMLLGWHYRDYYANDYVINQYLASQGYVVLSVNYRLGPGYGFDYHYPADAGPRGASEYRDVQAAAHYLQSLPNVDGQRLGIYGGSYGGYLTAMALAHDSAMFKAGVDIHGVHDWAVEEYGGFFKRMRYEVPVDAERAMEVAWTSSPISALSRWTSPVLFIHGDDDRNVKVEQTIDLIQRLRARDVESESLILVDETHSIHRFSNVLRMNRAVVEFLQRRLPP